MGDVTYKNGDEMWSDQEEPHVARRREIIKKHPEIKKLYGYCPQTKYMVLMQVSVHVATAIWLATNEHSWLTFVLVSYVIGATMTHWLFLAIHEIAHDLAMPTKTQNCLLGMFANFPIVLPYSVVFKKYHLDHHAN
jgi:sphingolipid delta-4 desaturase